MSLRKLCLFILLPLAGFLSAMPARDASASGELRFGIWSEPSTFDPLSPSNTADGRSLLFNVFEGLVKSDTAGRLLPAVSESFAMTSDALEYSFVLRTNIRFNDGSPVTIEDVEFTLNEAKNAGYQGFSQIDSMEISGGKNITIRLKAPDPDFLPYLTIGIVPRNNPDREKSPIGTGPYSIQNYIPQQQLTLVKNPHYWQSDLPKLERITVLFAADTNALYTGLEGGNLDGAMVTGDIVEKLDSGKYEIVSGYSNSVQFMALNNAIKPLDDVRVRRALDYAVDSREIIDAAFYGRGEPSGSPLIPGLKLYYNEALGDPYPKDVAKAKALLAEAGYADGFDLEIKVPSNYSMHVDTAQVIVNQLAQINVRASIRLVDWAAWLTDTYRGRNYEATIISLDATTISPQSFLARYVSMANSNFLNYKNERYDSIYAAILKEINENNRIDMYREAQKIISDDAAGVYIQDIFAFKVFRKGFLGALNYPLYVIDFSTLYRN